LASWSYEADDGLIGEVTPERIQDSAATALFNFWTARVIERAFDDERAAAPALSPSSQQWVKALLWIVNHPEQAATYDQETGQSALWDDMGTEARETRGQVMLLSLFDAVEQLEEAFGSPDPMDWRWGRLHNRTFESLLPSLGGGVSPFTLPQPEEAYPEGYPRSGDNFNVDACNGGLGGTDYSCGGGAIMRFLVELDPAGVRSFNAQPGGQVWDPDSPHFRDTLEVWLNDQRYQVRFHPDQVAQGNQSHLLFR
jgi:penicillin amidase